MSSQTDERQQIQLQLEGLQRKLEWSEIQREHLLDRLDLLRLDNGRLEDRVEELERLRWMALATTPVVLARIIHEYRCKAFETEARRG